MTFNLRKTHKIVWMLLVILVPVLIVFSILEIKEPLLTDADLVVTKSLAPQKMVFEDVNFRVGVATGEGEDTLQIILKRPLKSASAVVFGITSKGNKQEYLGTIDKKGVYTFRIKKSLKNIKIHDGLKGEDIINIKL